MERSIILNGLGINLKTSVGTILSEKFQIPFFKSDSASIGYIQELTGLWLPSWCNRALLAMYRMKCTEYIKAIYDRSVIDHLCMHYLLLSDLIDPHLFPKEQTEFLQKYESELLEFENSFDAQHILIINDNDLMINEVLDIENASPNPGPRLDIYTNLEQYRAAEVKYLEYYRSHINNYIEIHLTPNLSWDDRLPDVEHKLLEIIDKL